MFNPRLPALAKGVLVPSWISIRMDGCSQACGSLIASRKQRCPWALHLNETTARTCTKGNTLLQDADHDQFPCGPIQSELVPPFLLKLRISCIRRLSTYQTLVSCGSHFYRCCLMNVYTSSPSHMVSNEIHGSPSALRPSFHICQQPVPVQGDPSLAHVTSQSVTLTFSQDQVARPNALTSPQLSDYTWQPSPVRGDMSVVHVPPQSVASAALSQDRAAQLNAPTLPHSPPHVWPETFPVQGDASPVHISPQFVPSALSQNPVAQTKSHTSPKQHACPNCRKKFRRRQELKRHVLSNLPHWIHCAFPCCAWTGNRLYSLKEHIEVHPNFNSGREPEQKESQIYDPKKLVESMARGTLAVGEAADIALSMVEERFAEPDKAGVEANVWGSRRKFCKARS